MNREYVFILQHSYLFAKNNKNGVKSGYEEVKILGVYSSREKAEEAMERYHKKDGFNRYDKSCFSIDRYALGKDTGWINGFEQVGDCYWLPPCFDMIDSSTMKNENNLCMGPGSEMHKILLWKNREIEEGQF